MLQSSNLLVLVVLAGSSYAVFYTKSTDNEYPRIGRRSFYTTGNGYPRIGRRDGEGRFLSAASPDTLSEWDGTTFEKRGLYTSGGGYYPRVGRTGQSMWHHVRANLLRAALRGNDDDDDGDDDGDMTGAGVGKEGQGRRFDLELMFVAFDENDDNQLSKEEFTKGMEKYRRQNPLC